MDSEVRRDAGNWRPNTPARSLRREGLKGLPVNYAATGAEDMNPPGYRFHALKGDRKGTYAVSVSGNWRLTFRFVAGDAVDVDLEDYH
jgi:plasmid maintenance system killer protein